MHGRERDAAPAQRRHRARHGLGDVEELQVDEHPLVAPGEFVQHAEVVAAGQQLHADLVEVDRIAKPVDPRQRFGTGRRVQREDQALARGQRDGIARHHGA